MRNRIIIGSRADPDFVFRNETILSAGTSQRVALVGQELSVDTFAPVVRDDDVSEYDALVLRTSDGELISTALGEILALSVVKNVRPSPLIHLAYGTPVFYYQNDALIGKFYLEKPVRVGPNAYRLNCVSAIGLLDAKQHDGGLFLSSTFGDVLRHIMAENPDGSGDPVIDFEIDEELEDLTVSCYLPHGTKRNNLYQLCFANGVNIVKDCYGDPRFTFLYPSDYAEEIQLEDTYYEGEVEYEKPYAKISVLEHSYAPITSERAVTLFDNSSGIEVRALRVWFGQAPIIVSTLSASSGLAIVSAGVNGAVVTGTGVLTGVPYTHTTQEAVLGDESADETRTVSVTGCTAVNTLNSAGLLLRLRAFYMADDFLKKIKGSFVSKDLRCGKLYKFKSAFGEYETAFLAAADITASGINKAKCELYGNYTPAGQSGIYDRVYILDKETCAQDGGVFTLPGNTDMMKIVMIGGGTGGDGGYPGYNGQDAITYTYFYPEDELTAIWYGAEGGDGGDGGEGGTPGKVDTVTIVVDWDEPVLAYNYTIGTGGDGGAAVGFRPDTLDEIRAAMEAENPGVTFTDQQLQAMIVTEQSQTDWQGSNYPGSAGTASTFDIYSSANGSVPLGGVYDPISDQFFALPGNSGIHGGKGGAREIESGGEFNWTTDGEDVEGGDGTVYHGGRTGIAFTQVEDLPEAPVIAYGGNGAGAAVGLDRADHEHMDGGSDQEASWEVVEVE